MYRATSHPVKAALNSLETSILLDSGEVEQVEESNLTSVYHPVCYSV